MSKHVLERYASPRWPHLFANEMMFKVAGTLKGKRVLEIGCGEGVASTQLAYCGAEVVAFDISPVSIEVARERAQLNGQDVQFIVGDFTTYDMNETDHYDVVWCDLILHHLVDSLDSVLDKVHRCLKPGGLFVAREPLAYARWLKRLRYFVPVKVEATDDEQPLRESELRIIRQRFPNVQMKYYRVMARADRLGASLAVLRSLARLDNLILSIPGSAALAANAVLWGYKAETSATTNPRGTNTAGDGTGVESLRDVPQPETQPRLR
jgi:SAM-dependent methyltransferase